MLPRNLTGVLVLALTSGRGLFEVAFQTLARSRLGLSYTPVTPLEWKERMSVRSLVVDDYQVARKTIRSLLNWQSMRVCGEAENGKQAVEKVKELNPDLVLLDINMPVMNGVQAAYEIRRIAPSKKVFSSPFTTLPSR